MEETNLKWRVLSASVPGSSHLRCGLECQDVNAVSVLSDGTLIVVVSDGAGSAKRAADGAALVAQSCVAHLEQHVEQSAPADSDGWKCLLVDCIEHARTAAFEFASRQTEAGNPTEYVDLATTVLIVVVTGAWVAAAQVGDGAIVSRSASGSLSVLTVQGDSEYINETTFITSSDYLAHAHFHVDERADITGVAAFSDGMQFLALKYADNTAHAPFFDPLLVFAARPDSSLSDLEEFLRSERVCGRTDDDKTLVLAVRL